MIHQTYRNVSDALSILDVFLWTICVGLFFVFSLYTCFRLIHSPNYEASALQKKNSLSWAIAFLLLGISNILNLLWRYVISELEFRQMVDNLSVLLVNVALFIKIFQTEYTINKYKFYRGYYFSVATIGLLIFTTLVTPEVLRVNEIYQIVYLILLMIGCSIFPLIFLYLAIKLKGKARIMAFRVLTGAILIAIGLLIQPHNMERFLTGIPNQSLLLDMFLILCPCMIILATIMIFRSYHGSL